jgi:hypothetical protein
MPVRIGDTFLIQTGSPDAAGNRTRSRLPDDLILRVRQGVFDSPRAKRWARDDLTKCQRLERKRDEGAAPKDLAPE